MKREDGKSVEGRKMGGGEFRREEGQNGERLEERKQGRVEGEK